MKRIFVIGGANIDITGKVLNDVYLKESNIGKISYSFGGVGRNVAENLAHLGAEVSFLTVFGNDAFAKELKEYMGSLSIDISDCQTSETNGSSIYLSVLDRENDLLVGLSDMDVLDELTTESIDRFLSKTKKDDILFVDTNLQRETIEYIFQHASCQIAVDPISSVKAKRLEGLLSYLSYFKPNNYEAENFSGLSITDEASAKEVLSYFASQGVKETVISLGSHGVLVKTESDCKWYKNPPIQPVSATGAGDAFFACYLRYKAENLCTDECVRRACIGSVLTLLSPDTCSPLLNSDRIEKEAESYPLEIIELYP